jgi:pyruvate dehydrogenase E1 component beta subunit
MYKKKLSYAEMISETLFVNMKKNKKIFIAGLEVNYSSKVFGSLKKPFEIFADRFVQSPAMENGLCAILAGAAINGLKPVFVNNRCDFLLLAFDSIVNIIDKWKYMFDGASGNCPIVITAVIGRGWGQGATHSQSFHNFFSRLSGIDVFLPTFPSDVRNILNYTLKSERPSIILQHRGLFELKEQIPKNKKYKYGRSNIVKKGKDLAIITLSYGTIQSLDVYHELKKEFNKKITIIDLVSLNPLDVKSILRAAKNHKKIIILDIDHVHSGLASEIYSIIMKKYKDRIIKKIGNAFSPAPTSDKLEKIFYPSNQLIFNECCALLNLKNKKKIVKDNYKFLGPY